ncbi:MAG: hypothetical protein HY817_02920 [Candidatus Abawacabacteria bacterium]|nr:hypothetical protein [Candidatus Abawacabacteria bacterium]
MLQIWKLRVLVLVSTLLTCLLAAQYLLMTWLLPESTPEWLMMPQTLFTLMILWLYSTLNVFNCAWQERNDNLLELIHGFSLVGALWSIGNVWQLFSLDRLGELGFKIESVILIIVFFLTTIRCLLNSKYNRWNNITRWIATVSISIFMGLNLVSLFLEIDPFDPLFDNLWLTSSVLTITAIISTIVLRYLPQNKKTN